MVVYAQEEFFGEAPGLAAIAQLNHSHHCVGNPLTIQGGAVSQMLHPCRWRHSQTLTAWKTPRSDVPRAACYLPSTPAVRLRMSFKGRAPLGVHAVCLATICATTRARKQAEHDRRSKVSKWEQTGRAGSKGPRRNEDVHKELELKNRASHIPSDSRSAISAWSVPDDGSTTIVLRNAASMTG